MCLKPEGPIPTWEAVFIKYEWPGRVKENPADTGLSCFLEKEKKVTVTPHGTEALPFLPRLAPVFADQSRARRGERFRRPMLSFEIHPK
jgi:hypothetical protein